MHSQHWVVAAIVTSFACQASVKSAAPAKNAADIYQEANLYKGQYAVVIGVSSYPNGKSLKYAHTDACRMGHYLRDQGAKVVCCFESNKDDTPDFTRPIVPTSDGLQQLMQRYNTRGSRFLFYFSGHSRQVLADEGDGARRHTLLMMPQPTEPVPFSAAPLNSDAPYADECRTAAAPGPASAFRGPKRPDLNNEALMMPVPTVDVGPIVGKTLLSLGGAPAQLTKTEFDELGQVTLDIGAWFRSGIPWFSDKQPLSTVVMADGCDLELRSGKGLNLSDNPDLTEPSTLWLTASRGGQATYELESGQGLFTAALLQGLSGAADNRTNESHLGWIRASELDDYLPGEVRKLWLAEKKGGSAPVPNIVYYNPNGPQPGGTTMFVNPFQTTYAPDDLVDIRQGHAPVWAWGTTLAGAAITLGSLGVFLYQNNHAHQAERDYEGAALPDEAVRREAVSAGRRARYAEWGILGGGLAGLGGVVWTICL